MARQAIKTAESTIRAAQARAGYFRQTDKMCDMAHIPVSSFYYKIKCGTFTLSELKRMDMVLHFTDEEIIQLVRG